MNIFGNKDALIGSIELAIAAALDLGSLIFRKSVANDMLNMDFSVIGSSALGIIGFLVMTIIGLNTKIAVGVAIVAWALGGFLTADFIGDGGTSE